MAPTDTSWVPAACTLPTVRQPLRVAEFAALFATALRTVDRVELGRVRLVLDGADEVETTARDLARRETECCSFFTFEFTRGQDELRVDITVSDGHRDVLDALADQAVAGLPAGARG